MLEKIKQRKQQKGFTLIEIVLVMALAALILLLVFLALSGAQRARRDTARKEDAARMLAAIESCASNNSGQYTNCTTNAQLVTGGYFKGQTDPDGSTTYTVVNTYPVPNPMTKGVMDVQTSGAGATCPGDPAGSTGLAAVYNYQETGAGATAYCVDNH